MRFASFIFVLLLPTSKVASNELKSALHTHTYTHTHMIAKRFRQYVTGVQVKTRSRSKTQHMHDKLLSCHRQPRERDCYKQLICLPLIIITKCNRLKLHLPSKQNTLPTFQRTASRLSCLRSEYVAYLSARDSSSAE